MITFLELGNFGRLGNQMWQIASVLGIGKENNQPVLFPEWPYSKYFDDRALHNDVFSLSKLEHGQVYQEREPYFNMPKLEKTYNYNLSGYFQSYKYFESCEILIRGLFDFGASPNYSLNQVSIHVRRGDYLSLSHIHPILGMNYYNEAMSLYPKDTEYAIFSDDYNWCRVNFRGDQFHFYDIENDIIQFKIMSQCKDNIIANSSYSWWAAWLNKTPDKIVIAPKIWVLNEIKDDRVPKEWIRI